MKNKLIIGFVLLLIIIGCAFGVYIIKKRTITTNVSLIPTLETKENTGDIEGFNKYEAEKNPKIPEYSLPLKNSEIANLKDIQEIASISKSALSLLSKNGFVVIPNTKLKGLSSEEDWGNVSDKKISSDFVEYYNFIFYKTSETMKETEEWGKYTTPTKHLPMFITSDSILHYFHLMFDATLIRLETSTFYDYLWDISKGLFDKTLAEYNNTKDPIIKEAAKRNVGYFSVALNLLGSGQKKSIYDNPLYEEQYSTQALASLGDCVRTLEEGKYSKVFSCLQDPFGYNDTYIVEGKILRGDYDYRDIENLSPETNANKIIETCFKQENFISKEDIVKMKEIQEECEKEMIAFIGKNNFMDVIPGDPKYSFTTPEFVKREVNNELAKIDAHKGWSKSSLFIYEEDYSQYVPRAHYTKSEKLKKYFKTMMWYGRMTMLAKGRSDLNAGESLCNSEGLISSYDAKIQTAQSILISYYLTQDQALQTKLNKLTDIVDFLVGGADDLGPREYLPIAAQSITNVSDISKKIDGLQKTILNLNYNPKIYSGLGKCEMDVSLGSLNQQVQDMLSATKGFRLFGQKFVPDSYWMSMIVSPYSGVYNGTGKEPFSWVVTSAGREVKGFPRGLDVASILGSSRADEIIKETKDDNYTEYKTVMEKYKAEVRGYDSNVWYKTVYNSWLYALSALFNNFVKGYPTFMLTKAYQDKSLTTALASWTQLRHDTLLYVKQGYTMAEGGGGSEPVVVGYVEPIPELYIRLYKSTLIFKNKLLSIFPKPEGDMTYQFQEFDALLDMLENVIVISNKELRHEVLTEKEYLFIDNFASNSERLVKWLASNKDGGDIVMGVDEIINPIMVADVYTEGNTKTVLEEAVGKIRTGLFAYRAPQNNNIILGIGPVFSYYEFKQPMDKRLTDEQWREMLFKNIQPDKPEWVSNFYTNY